LEVVLALGVAVFVLRGVFALAEGALRISESIATEGRNQISQETFLTFLERNFESLPGNAVLDLKSTDRGSHFISEITFQKVPIAFSWQGQSLSPEAIQLATVLRANGTLDIVLRYYDEEILDETAESEALQIDPIAELVLLRNVWRFEWEVLDGRTMEWDYEWDIQGRQPLQLRLNAVFHPDGDEVVHYFWVPPKVNPETIINSNNRLPGGTRGGGQQQPDSGGEGGEGGGGGNPTIQPPRNPGGTGTPPRGGTTAPPTPGGNR
jgi:hypothetical protein